MLVDLRIPRAARVAACFAWLLLPGAVHAAPQAGAPAATVEESPPDAARAGAPALPPFERVLPADTLAWFGIDDVTALSAGLEASPYGRMLQDPAFEPLCRTVGAQVGLLRAAAQGLLGADPLQLAELIDGPLSLAVSLPQRAAGEAASEPAFTLCLLADVGEQRAEAEAWLTRLAASAQRHDARLRAGRASVAGVDCHTLSLRARTPAPPRSRTLHGAAAARGDDERGTGVLTWGFRGPLLLAAFTWNMPESAVLAAVLAGLDGQHSGPVLADVPAFRESLAAQAGGCRAWADAGAVARLVTGRAGRSGPAGARGADIAGALGLGELGAVSQRLTCGSGGSEWAAGVQWTGDGWIPQLARLLCSPGGARTLELVPATCRSASVLHVDAPQLFDRGLKMLLELRAVTPAEIVSGLAALESTLGFSLRDDLLELLDGELAVVTRDAAREDAFPGTALDPVNFAVVVGLRDGAAFGALVDEAVRSTGFHAARVRESWQGLTLEHFTLLPPFTLHYAILDDAFVASPSGALLREMLELRVHPDLPSLAGTPALQAALARLPEGWGLLDYNDTAASLQGALKALQGLPAALAGAAPALPPEVRGLLGWLQTLPLPDASVVSRYVAGPTVTAVAADARGLRLYSVGP